MRPLAEIISEIWRDGNMAPEIRRQLPPKKEVQLPPGSILASAIPVSSLKEEKFNLVLYGRNRSGKTTLAAQFDKPLLIISSEPDANGGATSISNIDGISLIRVAPEKLPGDRMQGSAKVVAIANELKENNPFKTVVLDTITSLQDVIYVELLGLPKIPDQMNWGVPPDGLYPARSEKLRATVRPLLDLKTCNVVILAQEKDHNASDDRGGKSKLLRGQRGEMQQGSFMAPALGSGTSGWLCDNCGYVIQIYENEVQQEVLVPQNNPDGTPGEPIVTYVGTGKRQRHLRLLYHPNFAAGGRWQFDRNVPEFVTAPTPRELYKAMAKYIPSLKV